jgi:hypothetical protein
MFSTNISDLAHWEQIKDSYKASNNVNPSHQILDIYTRHQSFEMRLFNHPGILESCKNVLDSTLGCSTELKQLFDIGKQRAPVPLI